MIIIDANNVLGVKTSLSAFLEVSGERYCIDTAYTKTGGKALTSKWGEHAQTLGLPFTTTASAKEYIA